jgi:non-ribosomal peptide synthetase component F
VLSALCTAVATLLQVPVGVPGRMYIGGPCLALGYLNMPDKTAERFLANPYRYHYCSYCYLYLNIIAQPLGSSGVALIVLLLLYCTAAATAASSTSAGAYNYRHHVVKCT